MKLPPNDSYFWPLSRKAVETAGILGVLSQVTSKWDGELVMLAVYLISGGSMEALQFFKKSG